MFVGCNDDGESSSSANSSFGSFGTGQHQEESIIGQTEAYSVEEEEVHNEFMGSLVNHYESLVNDMSQELLQCHAMLANSRGEEGESGFNFDIRQQLSRKDAIIENLRMQVEVLTKSRNASKVLLYSTLEHVERLETSKKIMQNESNKEPLSPSFLSKWRALHTYASSLEEQSEKLTKEASFYRNKILQIRVEQEEFRRQNEIDKSNCIQQAQRVLKNELDQLKLEAEKIRSEFEASVEKRLLNEQEIWEYKEAQSLRLVRIQVEQLLLENDRLQSRERDLEVFTRNLETELEQLKHQHVQAMSELTDASRKQLLQQVSDPSTVVVNTFIMPSTSAMYTQTEPIAVDLDQKERLKEIQTEMEIKGNNLKMRLKAAEYDTLQKVSRLQGRIQQLEALNTTLNSQYKDICDKYEKLRLRLDEKQFRKPPSYCSCIVNKKNGTTANYSIGNIDIPEKLKEKEMPLKNSSEEVEAYEKKMIISEKIKNVQILRLQGEIGKLLEEQRRLLQVVREQKDISFKWKSEFKELAKRTLS